MGRIFTKQSSSKYIAWCIYSFSIVTLFLVSVLLIINFSLLKSKETIDQYINASSPLNVQFDSIRFSLFRGILLENVTVHETLGKDLLLKPFHIRQVQFKPHMVLSDGLSFNLGHMVLIQPQLETQESFDKIKGIYDLVRNLPSINIKFGPINMQSKIVSAQIKDGRLILVSDNAEIRQRRHITNIQYIVRDRLFLGPMMRLNADFQNNATLAFYSRAKDYSRKGEYFNLKVRVNQLSLNKLKAFLPYEKPLPDKKLNGTIKIKLRKGNEISLKGSIPLKIESKKSMISSPIARLLPKSITYEAKGHWNKRGVHLLETYIKVRSIKFKGHVDLDLTESGPILNVLLLSNSLQLRPLFNQFTDWEFNHGSADMNIKYSGKLEEFQPVIFIQIFPISASHIKTGKTFDIMGGEFQWHKKRLRINDFELYINHKMIKINGGLDYGHNRGIDLQISSRTAYPGVLSKRPIQWLLKLSEDTSRGKWDAEVRIQKTNSQGATKPPLLIAQLHGIRAEWLNQIKYYEPVINGIVCQLDQISIQSPKYSTAKIDIDKPRIFIKKNKNIYFLRLEKAQWAKGIFFGEVSADLTQNPYLQLRSSLFNADSRLVAQQFGIDYPITGDLDAVLTMQGELNNLSSHGRFEINDGVLGPSPALNSIADETGIDALKKLKFKQFKSEIYISPGRIQFSDIQIKGDAVSFEAELISRDKTLSGTMNIKFPKKVIRKNSQIRNLMNMVGEKDELDLSFKIAGFLSAPRVEWLESKFKQSVRNELHPWFKDIFINRLQQWFSST